MDRRADWVRGAIGSAHSRSLKTGRTREGDATLTVRLERDAHRQKRAYATVRSIQRFPILLTSEPYLEGVRTCNCVTKSWGGPKPTGGPKLSKHPLRPPTTTPPRVDASTSLVQKRRLRRQSAFHAVLTVRNAPPDGRHAARQTARPRRHALHTQPLPEAHRREEPLPQIVRQNR